MPSYPFKKRRKYVHEVALVSNKSPELADVLIYTSEEKARDAKKALEQAVNGITVEYTKREVPIINEEGRIYT